MSLGTAIALLSCLLKLFKSVIVSNSCGGFLCVFIRGRSSSMSCSTSLAFDHAISVVPSVAEWVMFGLVSVCVRFI